MRYSCVAVMLVALRSSVRSLRLWPLIWPGRPELLEVIADVFPRLTALDLISCGLPWHTKFPTVMQLANAGRLRSLRGVKLPSPVMGLLALPRGLTELYASTHGDDTSVWGALRIYEPMIDRVGDTLRRLELTQSMCIDQLHTLATGMPRLEALRVMHIRHRPIPSSTSTSLSSTPTPAPPPPPRLSRMPFRSLQSLTGRLVSNSGGSGTELLHLLAAADEPRTTLTELDISWSSSNLFDTRDRDDDEAVTAFHSMHQLQALRTLRLDVILLEDHHILRLAGSSLSSSSSPSASPSLSAAPIWPNLTALTLTPGATLSDLRALSSLTSLTKFEVIRTLDFYVDESHQQHLQPVQQQQPCGLQLPVLPNVTSFAVRHSYLDDQSCEMHWIADLPTSFPMLSALSIGAPSSQQLEQQRPGSSSSSTTSAVAAIGEMLERLSVACAALKHLGSLRFESRLASTIVNPLNLQSLSSTVIQLLRHGLTAMHRCNTTGDGGDGGDRGGGGGGVLQWPGGCGDEWRALVDSHGNGIQLVAY